MQSKTSFFNKGVFFNNIKRFWLITFSYSFFLFLYIMGIINAISRSLEYTSTDIRDLSLTILQDGELMMIFLGFFSLVAALAVFSYMHFPKSTAMVHSLPLRRETLFVTNYLSGLFMVVVPLLLNTVILLIAESVLNIPSLSYTYIWLLVNLVLTFLLYTFAVFAGMFTGHLAAQTFYYLIFNFLAIFLEAVFNFVLRNLLFGYYEEGERLYSLSPLLKISELFRGFSDNKGDWLLLAGYFIAGVIFLVSSFFLYRKRHMETATDVVSIKVVKPIFKYSATFCSSALLGSIMVNIFNLEYNLAGFIITYLIGGLIGYFVCEMLLRKSFRVLNAYKGFVVYAVLLTLAFFAIHMDIVGYTTYVPQDSEVDIVWFADYNDVSAKLVLDPESYDPNKHKYLLAEDPEHPYVKNPPQVLNDEHLKKLRMNPGIAETREAITKARLIHKYIVENKGLFMQNLLSYENTDYYESNTYQIRRLYIGYKLKNGSVIMRNYFLVTYKGNTELDNLLREYLSIPEVLEKFDPLLKAEPEDIRYITLDVYYPEKPHISQDIEDVQKILEAYKKDARTRDPLSLMYGTNKGIINIELRFNLYENRKPYFNQNYYYRNLSEQDQNTTRALIEMGILKADEIEIIKSNIDGVSIIK